MNYHEILHFWFCEATPKMWFEKSNKFDQLIKNRYQEIHRQTIAGENFNWRKTHEGRLAEIIVLDQFSRNIYRDTAQAFAADPMALALAQEMVAISADQTLAISRRAFVYLPYMHSESRIIHEQAIKLMNVPGLEQTYAFELKHKSIIDRFNRYPHRNNAMGRPSTLKEMEFLKQHASGF